MNDDDTFLTVSGVRELVKTFAVGARYLDMGMSASKIQISDFMQSSSYATMLDE